MKYFYNKKSQTLITFTALPLFIFVGIIGYVLLTHRQSSLSQPTTLSQLSTLPTSPKQLLQTSPNNTQISYKVSPVPGWKTFVNPYLHYVVQYPSFLLSPEDEEYNPDGFGALGADVSKRAGIEQNKEITFYTPSKQFPGSSFAFDIAAGTLTTNNATNNVISRLAESLFIKPIGVITNPAPSGLNDSIETVTKLANLAINGNQAVFFTDSYAGSTQQPPNETEGYMIKKGDIYYLIDHGTHWTTGNKNNDTSIFKTIANSFSLLQ